MNNKGFTLIEIIGVITLLGLVLIITSTSVLSGSSKAKEKMLESKIDNIEKAAIIFAQENRSDFTNDTTIAGINDCLNEYCPKDAINNPISNCYCFEKTISVNILARTIDDLGNSIEPFIKYDEENKVINPINKNSMNDCKIQIYQKYGKIYADYIEEGNTDYKNNCWK